MADRKVPVPLIVLGFLLLIAIILFFLEIPILELPNIELPQFNIRDPFVLFGIMFFVFVIGGALYDKARKG